MDQMTPATAPITELLQLARQGNAQAEDQLFRAIFGQLRRLAVIHLSRENGTQQVRRQIPKQVAPDSAALDSAAR